MTVKVTLVSPYHGGSHRAWADGYREHGKCDVSLLSLPARFWKWRMHGGAVTLARQFVEAREKPDLILATDMLDVTTFVALTATQAPLALYMHENQLTYPLPADGTAGPMRRQRGERDLHYAFINYASMLAARRVFFNSAYHRNSFLAALPKFLRHFPEYNELGTISHLQEKSGVLPLGIEWRRLRDQRPTRSQAPTAPPLILWNQRWEYDKNPAAFFRVLYAVKAAGISFRLALCGENFRRHPKEFDDALERLDGHVVHVGYATAERYRELLWEADITISTAHHEFFGVSVVEAMSCQTFPLLPRRLSYPELLPEPFHRYCLYNDEADLAQGLRWALLNAEETADIAATLAQEMEQYDWAKISARYDAAWQEIVS